MAKKVYKRYSEAFRIQVVREYEQGEYSIKALHRRYGVNQGTLKKWIQKYSTQGLKYKLMKIQTPEEQDRLKELEAENARLKMLVADLQLDKVMLESTITVIQREYGIDVKKNGMKSSRKPARSRK